MLGDRIGNWRAPHFIKQIIADSREWFNTKLCYHVTTLDTPFPTVIPHTFEQPAELLDALQTRSMPFVTLYNHLPRIHFWAKRSLLGYKSLYTETDKMRKKQRVPYSLMNSFTPSLHLWKPLKNFFTLLKTDVSKKKYGYYSSNMACNSHNNIGMHQITIILTHTNPHSKIISQLLAIGHKVADL